MAEVYAKVGQRENIDIAETASMNARASRSDERVTSGIVQQMPLLNKSELQNAEAAEPVVEDLLDKITVTAPLGSSTLGAPRAPKANEFTPDVTDEHVAVVIDDGRIEDI
ncbi:MAG: hypothetical protein IJ600_10615, partial [Lachnospiraceae bacterium]|nr:hypothetical protein [Lachnospiraceae bacterium]